MITQGIEYLAWLDCFGHRHISHSSGNFPHDIPFNSVAHAYCYTAEEAATVKMRAVHFPRYHRLPANIQERFEDLVAWEIAEAPRLPAKPTKVNVCEGV